MGLFEGVLEGVLAIFAAGNITLSSIFGFTFHLHEKNKQLKLEDFIQDTTYDDLKTKKFLKSSMIVEDFEDGKKVTLYDDTPRKGIRFIVTRDPETSYKSEFLDFVEKQK